jgi:hypothetical protein
MRGIDSKKKLSQPLEYGIDGWTQRLLTWTLTPRQYWKLAVAEASLLQKLGVTITHGCCTGVIIRPKR